jgi:hypothetical protein
VFLSHRYNVGFNRKVKMTEEEIAARKFAIASQKDEQERRSREEAEREAKKNGTELQQPNRDEKTFAGRPDDAVIAGAEPVAGTDSLANEGRISIGSKAAADSLLAIDKKQAEDTMWLKNEYVPVTSFIHTLQFDNYKRIYQFVCRPATFLKYITKKWKRVAHPARHIVQCIRFVIIRLNESAAPSQKRSQSLR